MAEPLKRADEEIADNNLDEGREPWPEEVAEPSRHARARSYFREHPRAKWVLLAATVVLGAAIWFVWHYYSVRESTDDAQIDGHIVPISARVSGTVTQVTVEEDTYVKRGQVLVQLDPRDYQIAVERAKADLATARANLAAARTGVPITRTSSASQLDVASAALIAARKEADAAQARVQEAQANYTKVSADLNRMKQLVAKDEISQQQYDAAVAAEQSAQATVDAARANLAAAQTHVAQSQAQVAGARTAPQQVAVTQAKAGAAEADVDRYQAALNQAELNLQYCTIRAPVDGIVTKRSVEPGQTIRAGQPLFAEVDLEDVWVIANFKETQLKDMRPGERAEIEVDAYGKTYHGSVEQIGGATGARLSLLPPENATGNYVKVVQRIPVKIAFEKGQDPNHLLRPGMSVVPTVFTK